jgi:hypothetical protein
MTTSACGITCTDCPFFGKECKGCYLVEGKTFWAAGATENGVCPLFDCSVNTRGYKNCGDCPELPCKTFHDLKDPNSTEEEHRKSIEVRVRALRS